MARNLTDIEKRFDKARYLDHYLRDHASEKDPKVKDILIKAWLKVEKNRSEYVITGRPSIDTLQLQVIAYQQLKMLLIEHPAAADELHPKTYGVYL